ncbi:MAG: tryptophan synthase subunit alpha [Lachnospiraceae bacterium]|nr:tryptophan synthase subunit alpha [Lachnospiraceae bacterium]
MSKLNNILEKKNMITGFVTAGDPSIETAKENIMALVRAGVEVVEIGVPFSDPVAEGPVVQSANVRALANGCTLPKIFDMIEELREITQVPFVLMTYANPMYNYGFEAFCQKCKAVGVDGIIVPDIPYEESAELRVLAKDNDIELITMVALSSMNRIEKLVKDATGYIRLNASAKTFHQDKRRVEDMMQEIRKYTEIPVLFCGNVETKEEIERIHLYTDGVVLDNALVERIAEHGKAAAEKLTEYIGMLTGSAAKAQLTA